MEFYEEANSCDPGTEPAPVVVPEPAPLPAFEPAPPAPPAAEIIFPEPATPVAAPPAPAVPDAPQPLAVPEPQPLAPVPLTSGTLLGPSTIGGSPDLGGSGFVGGSPDLGGSGFVGGSPNLGSSMVGGGGTDLGLTWVDDNGTPVPAPQIPVVPGPFNAAAASIMEAHNTALIGGVLGSGGAAPAPAYWTPGHDGDHDGLNNERDRDPRNPYAR